MRLLGMILALGAIGWLLYNAAGGEDAQSVIPESYQESLEKAQGVQDIVNGLDAPADGDSAGQ